VAPRIVRGQVALEVGDKLKDIGAKILRLHEYSGEALESQLGVINASIGSALNQIDVLLRSCRAAKNSYPNYPALRKVIADAADKVYEMQEKINELQASLNSDASFPHIGSEFMIVGQDLRTLPFVVEQRKEPV
jgi:hypothetical protein